MKKLVSFLMSTIIIFQIVDKTCFSVTAHHIVHDFSVKEFQIDDDISLNPIEIFEGEQLQLCFTSVDKSEITYVASLSLEHKATISSDLILTGYCAGEDVLHIYIDQNGKSIDDKTKTFLTNDLAPPYRWTKETYREDDEVFSFVTTTFSP